MKIKRILSLLLCVALLGITAFGADFTYGSGTLLTSEEILAKFTKLLKNEGAVQPPIEDEISAEDSGFVYIAVDAFTLGGGYVMEPSKLELHEGDTVASILIRAFALNGLYADYEGTEREDFYLHRIGGVNFVPNTEPELEEWLKDIVTYYEPEEWSGGVLGEFDITDMAGWMYYVNGETSMEAMSACEVYDGDVISVRFSLAYGMDLGGEAFGDVDEPYTKGVNLSEIAKAIANGKLSREDCERILNKASVSQEEVDELLRNI